ncbi:hypothetical protein [Palleronia sp.]|uniref:hypothetical protein n=1 Tax=Palleronia sp. TaxID=1940284 RepID=UPI0035C845E2
MAHRGAGALILAAVALGAPAAVAQEQNFGWLDQIQDQRCDPEIREKISSNVRGKIEAHIARAEAAINAPIPIGDLSCLDDLMNESLDIFSNIGGLMGSLSAGLGSVSGGDVNEAFDGMDLSSQVCSFAQKKWAEVTTPLNAGLDELDIAHFADQFDFLNYTPPTNQPRAQADGGSGGQQTNQQQQGQTTTRTQSSGNSSAVQSIWSQSGTPRRQ